MFGDIRAGRGLERLRGETHESLRLLWTAAGTKLSGRGEFLFAQALDTQRGRE